MPRDAQPAHRGRQSLSSPRDAKKQQVPKNWPPELRYLTSPVYSSAVTATQSMLAPASLASSSSSGPSRPSDVARILPISSPSNHPARGQHGLFAIRHLPPDTLILDYLGFVHSSAESDPEASYDLSLDRHLGVAVDATHMGNEARFINDYRGIREAPNAEFREHVVDGLRRMSVWVVTAGKSGRGKKGIRRGEEICLSYGKGFWRETRESDGGSADDVEHQ